MTVPLPPGSYEGEATLVDSGQSAVLDHAADPRCPRRLGIPILTIDIDFPSTSRI